MQFGQLKRRDVIALAGGAAATLGPFAVRAQQLKRIRRIGVLTFFAADDPESKIFIAAFLQQMQQLG